ncbi:MAG: histidine phosphatase family protein [Winogradskyella sp.]|uniref:SixA phosphatase family protein n=1 Tax=Winogradskyella sp. TaxID=1883156 RepID=UPI001815C32B|nr:histidine phosphatase family protein [Winogradskyella sp.]
MKNLSLLLIITLIAFSSCAQKSATNKDRSVYYLIRHAEKDKSDKTNRDPKLTVEGKNRAESWAKYFKDKNLDAVYSTDYNRTRETALPTTITNGLGLQFYNPGTINYEEFLKNTRGKKVLIVGHSNTTPMFANGLLGEEKYEAMTEDDNSSLYKVTVAKDTKISEILVID